MADRVQIFRPMEYDTNLTCLQFSCLYLDKRRGCDLPGDIRQLGVLLLLTGALTTAKTGRLFGRAIIYIRAWIAQMEEHWYSNPEVSLSSPGPVKLVQSKVEEAY